MTRIEELEKENALLLEQIELLRDKIKLSAHVPSDMLGEQSHFRITPWWKTPFQYGTIR